MSSSADLSGALAPLLARVRTDVTAVKRADGVQAWTHQSLTPERIAQHLNGGPARGVCPIKEGESVTMLGLLDFDSHGGEVGWEEMSVWVIKVADVLELAYGCSPILFRSGGGRGVHLYVLWEFPQDAYSVREMFKGALAACGLKSGTGGVVKREVEIFPRQDSVPLGGFGNQFLLPLANASVPLSIQR